jgi:hypothetical protein
LDRVARGDIDPDGGELGIGVEIEGVRRVLRGRSGGGARVWEPLEAEGAEFDVIAGIEPGGGLLEGADRRPGAAVEVEGEEAVLILEEEEVSGGDGGVCEAEFSGGESPHEQPGPRDLEGLGAIPEGARVRGAELKSSGEPAGSEMGAHVEMAS